MPPWATPCLFEELVAVTRGRQLDSYFAGTRGVKVHHVDLPPVGSPVLKGEGRNRSLCWVVIMTPGLRSEQREVLGRHRPFRHTRVRWRVMVGSVMQVSIY